ncbi:MAG: Amino acid/amide transporter substrate-binding protein family [Enterovirga sp.]|jgi:branched-chain amino acid transport system substrate-binding protein|nr:Amino acid/amide transporter substrate-binding protein family [Enterovirga sp.]
MIRLTTIARGASLLLAAALVPSLAAAQDKPLKLGAIFALSGPNASIGKEALGGAQFAVQTLNAEGVTIGGQRYKVELVNADDESKTERSVAAAEKLIGQDNVPVIFMPPSSTTTLAVLPIAEKNKRIAMSFVAAAPSVVSPEFKYSFRNTLTSIMNVSPSVEYLIKTKGAKTLAYLGRNDDWGRAAGKAIKEKAAELNAKIVVEEYFEPGSTDFYGMLTKVRGANPDAVIGAAFTEDGISMLKQYRELRMKPAFLSVAVIWASPTFLSAAGPTTEGIYISTGPTTTESPELARFKDAFLKETGGKALPFGITAYDTVRMTVEAMKKAGTTDPEKVADTLRTFDYKGLLQTYRFENGNQSQVVINVNEVKNGQVGVISSLVTN